MFKSIQKVLILGAHPDDGEFSSGGTIARLVEEGVEVHYAIFSNCDKSLPAGFNAGAIVREWHDACEHLGIAKENRYEYDYEVRQFPAMRQEILEDMVALNRSLKPDLVFLPAIQDVHQDHHIIAQEGVRAFKFSNVLAYEMPWNNFSFHTSFYVALEKRHIEAKIEAIAKYKTQEFRSYSGRDFAESLGKLRGIQIRKEFAEAFELIRWTA